MKDTYGREIDYMRVSVTDRCNLRCKYCMPETMPFVSHDEILRSEEIVRVCRLASELGIKNIRITGGEPLVRRGVMDLLREIKKLPLVEHLALTTNGVLLEQYAKELADIKLDGVNISLDTLSPATYHSLTGVDAFDDAWRGIEAVLETDIRVKLNCVPLRGINEGEYAKIAALAEERRIDVRFIEAMPVGEGKEFAPIDGESILNELRTVYPDLKVGSKKRGLGPARYFVGALKGSIGFINAMSSCFCEKCNRIRLTSVGMLKLCLYHDDAVDLGILLKNGASDDEIKAAVTRAVLEKPEKHDFTGGQAPGEGKKMWQIGG